MTQGFWRAREGEIATPGKSILLARLAVLYFPDWLGRGVGVPNTNINQSVAPFRPAETVIRETREVILCGVLYVVRF